MRALKMWCNLLLNSKPYFRTKFYLNKVALFWIKKKVEPPSNLTQGPCVLA